MSVLLSPRSSASSQPPMEPPAKRQRTLAKACESCKGRKSKCDSVRPRCATCQKKGIDCVYREKTKPGLRPGYGKAVEERLEQLEDSIQEISSTLRILAASASFPPGRTANEPDLPNGPITGVSQDAPASTQRFQIGQTGGGDTWAFGDEIQTRPIEETNQEALNGHQVQALYNDTSSANVAEGPSYSTPGISQDAEMNDGLPPRAILEELVELFFQYVYPSAKLFHKPTFIDSMWVEERRILLHAIVMISFRFWNKTDPAPDVRNRYVQVSRDKVLLNGIDSFSVVSTQALALLAFDSFGRCMGERTTNIMSILTTALEQLGLVKEHGDEAEDGNFALVRNEDLTDTRTSSLIEEEERLRLFWFVFSLDRFVSLSNGSRCRINDKQMRHRFPSTDADWETPIPTDFARPGFPLMPFILDATDNTWQYFIGVLGLLDGTHQFLLQPIDSYSPSQCHSWQCKFKGLDLGINAWSTHLPNSLKERPDSFDPMWVTIHATLYAVIIRMHSIAAFPRTGSPYFQGSPSAAKRCREAVESLTLLFQPLSDEEIDMMSPLCAFLVWVASRNLIILWTAEEENTPADSPGSNMPTGLDALLDVLRRMANRWESAQRYVDLLQLVIENRNCPDDQARLRIFTDTRRTARGLDHLLGKVATEYRLTKQIELFDWLDFSIFDHLENGKFADG